MKELLFGTAGIPLSTEPRNTESGISKVKEIGLGCMELEFVHSVNISKEKAPDIKNSAKKKDIVLTCHAPYFINLNSDEPKKIHASIYRIMNSAERLYECGGWSVCFHPGFYMKSTKEAAYPSVKDNIKKISRELEEKGIDVWLRPETTGKPTQFGDYIELLRISQETEKVMPVFDFSHIHARTNGKYNTLDEFRKILEDVEFYLGRTGLDNMHIHLSGINYGEKGEKNHLVLQDSDMNYIDLIKTWKEFKIKGCIISESPNIEADAILMKKTYEEIK